MSVERYFDISTPEKSVPCILNSARGQTWGVILAHGAGGDASSGHLPTYAKAFQDAGLACLRFYVSPPNIELRTRCMQAVVKYAVEKLGWQKYILAGHSMGGRVACHVADQTPDAEKCLGMILFSYPLHAPKKPEELRNKPIEDLALPILFVHGTRDDSAEQTQWDELIKKMTETEKKQEVYVVEGGDHGLKVKGGAKAAVAALEGIVTAVMAYCKKLAGGEVPQPEPGADAPELPGDVAVAEPPEEEYAEEEEEEEVIELAVDDEEFELSEEDEEDDDEDEEDTDDEIRPRGGGGGGGSGSSGFNRKRKMQGPPSYQRTPPHKMQQPKYRWQDDGY